SGARVEPARRRLIAAPYGSWSVSAQGYRPRPPTATRRQPPVVYDEAMGMFDTIRFDNDIPDPELRDREWQTKSLENALIHYRISSDGELFETRTETRTRENPD